jgi:hypothetical protein
MMGRYRFGPIDRMILVDAPPGGFDEEPVEFGGTHFSLNGTATKDVFGYKRKWSIPLVGLAPTALSWFELCYRMAVTQPYFLDEKRINRLSAAASSTLSAWDPADAFTASQGPTVLTTTTTGVPARLSTTSGSEVLQALAPMSALRWSPTVAGTVMATDALVPVSPGEVVCFSVYILDGICTVELVPYGPTLVAGAAVTGGVDLAENVTRRYLTYTVPTNGTVVAVRPRLRVLAADTVDTIGWQVEASALPTPWVLGSPAARVLVSLGTGKRRHFANNLDGTLVLTEV